MNEITDYFPINIVKCPNLFYSTAILTNAWLRSIAVFDFSQTLRTHEMHIELKIQGLSKVKILNID